MATLGALMVKIGSDISGLERGLAGAQARLQSTGAAMQGVGMGLTAGVTMPLLGIAAAALSSAGQFEQTMNVMGQVTGATADEMAGLQAEALRLGAVTSFSAGEAADAMLELGKAGLGSQDILKATAGVMDLAAAGGLGLAEAATITSNALNAFHLPAEEATNVANMLAAAANASSVDVTDLAQSFSSASSVFASNGQSISDLTTALAILGNNSLKGADAGTSLKTMMMALAAPTDKAAGVLADLGVKVYDSTGAMRSFESIVGDLTAATSGLSAAQRNAALDTIFGSDAIRAANILIDSGAGAWKKMETAVNKTGAAQAVANARMKGMSGAIEYFKGSLDSLLITAGRPFLDFFGEWIRYGADLLTSLTTLDQTTQMWVLGIAAAAAAIGPLLLGLGTALTLMGSLTPVIGALLGPLGLLILAVAGLAAVWYFNLGDIQGKTQAAWNVVQPILSEWRAWAQETLPQAWETLKGKAAAAWETAKSAVTGAWGVVQPILNEWWTWAQETLPQAWETLKGKAAAAWETIKSAITTAWSVVQPPLQALWDSLAKLTDQFASLDTNNKLVVVGLLGLALALGAVALGFVGTGGAMAAVVAALGAISWPLLAVAAGVALLGYAWMTNWGGIRDKTAEVWALLKPTFDRLVESFGKMTKDLGGLGDEFGNLWAAAQPIVYALGVAIGATLGVVAITAINLLASTFERLGSIVGTVVNFITDTLNLITSTLKNVVDLTLALIDGDWQGVWDAGKRIVADFYLYFNKTLNNLWTLAADLFGLISDTILNTLRDLGVDVDGWLLTLHTAWSVAWALIFLAYNAVQSALLSGWNTLKTWVTVTLPAGFTSLVTSAEEKWASIQTAVSNAVGGISALFSSMNDWLTTKLQAAFKTFKDFISGFSITNPFAGLGSSLDGLLGKINSVIEAMKWLAGMDPGSAGASDGSSSGSAGGGESRSGYGYRQPAMQPAAGAVGGGTVNVYVTVERMDSQLDIHALAYQVAAQLRQAMGR